LRAKLRLEAHAWLMVASKMRNKVYLRNLEQRHFDQYVDFLLAGVVLTFVQIKGAKEDSRRSSVLTEGG